METVFVSNARFVFWKSLQNLSFASRLNVTPASRIEWFCRDSPSAIAIKQKKLPTNLKCRRAWRHLLPPALALLCLIGPQARADADPAIEVAVRTQRREVFVDVSFHVRAMPQEAWAVMTDFDHATAFISKLEKSVILSRTEDTLVVSQKGTMGWGPFSVPLETVTEIHLTPYVKMQSHLLSGNMKRYDTTTRLIADSDGTRVEYHLDSIPDVWLPPLIGRALVEHEARARFSQLVAEILRRKALTAAMH